MIVGKGCDLQGMNNDTIDELTISFVWVGLTTVNQMGMMEIGYFTETIFMTAVDHISYPFEPPTKDTFIPSPTTFEPTKNDMESKTPPAKNQVGANQISSSNYKLSVCSAVPPLSPASSSTNSSNSSTPFTTSIDRPLSASSMPQYQRRHTTGAPKALSVSVPETALEGRPSVFLFIFVNPLSGNQQGNDLIKLPVQQFRLRQRPHVKVEIHNILDPDDRQAGFEKILWVQNMIREHQLPPLPKRFCPQHPKHKCLCTGLKNPPSMSRHLHILSGGGDGTVMSVFEMLAQYRIDLDLLFFSCIPFGTGNDFSQVLGWGRTTKTDDVLGPRLSHLESLILDRLDHGEAARLDVWQLVITSHASGYVRRAGSQKPPQQQEQQEQETSSMNRPPCLSTFTSATQCQHHSQQQVPQMKQTQDCTSVRRKMCNYVSIGVQGYVGSGFEERRAGKRWANIWAYTIEGAKWLFHRKFPPVTNFISRIVSSADPTTTLLSCKDPYGQQQDGIHAGDEIQTPPCLTKHPIDLVIQNIPHIWGRQIDLWGDARSGLEVVEGRSGPTDPAHWQPQKANDGYLELMVIGNMYSYIKKLANFRRHVSRIGQFGCPFNIEFRPPPSQPDKKKHPYEKENIICIMCDGEFYEIKDPKEISFELFNQIWTLGKNNKIRLWQMTPTTCGKILLLERPDVP
ncbi:ATP-NAD kinase-like domain-containing protein [Chlamydoabsidia padenii]|nr:ATP-NAD kinase-like domain-containing protein [Chlamydoabsidia padenii]